MCAQQLAEGLAGSGAILATERRPAEPILRIILVVPGDLYCGLERLFCLLELPQTQSRIAEQIQALTLCRSIWSRAVSRSERLGRRFELL